MRARPWRRRQAGSFRPLRRVERLTSDDLRVLALLQQSPLRVWPRKTLAEAAGLSDRALRESVSRITTWGGVAVLSRSEKPGGYWIATTAAEVEEARHELLSRMRVINDRAGALEQVARLMRDRGASGTTARPLALV